MSRRGDLLFLEKQSLRSWHSRIILAFPPAALIFMTCRQVIWHKPWGSPPQSDGGLLFLSVLLVAVYLRLITVKLVTELRRDALIVRLRGLWRKLRVDVTEINSADPVTFDPVADFGGYGIRTRHRRTAYIARGNRGVQLVLSNGKQLLIGSQTPELLAARIHAALARVQ
jgi:hypothetical protein